MLAKTNPNKLHNAIATVAPTETFIICCSNSNCGLGAGVGLVVGIG